MKEEREQDTMDQEVQTVSFLEQSAESTFNENRSFTFKEGPGLKIIDRKIAGTPTKSSNEEANKETPRMMLQ